MHYFSIFLKKFNKACVQFFAPLDEKHKLLENFEKIFENFEKKIAKNALFLAFFSNKLRNYGLIFCAIGRKTQIVGKFWENFGNF